MLGTTPAQQLKAVPPGEGRSSFEKANPYSPLLSLPAVYRQGQDDRFSPSIAEVAAAKERMIAFKAAQADGRASVGVDGKMVDIPVAERARRILTRVAAIEAKEAKVRAAFAALGEIPPRGALVYVS